MLWRCLVLQAPSRARPIPPARQAVVEMNVVVAAHQHGAKASRGRTARQALSSNSKQELVLRRHGEALEVYRVGNAEGIVIFFTTCGETRSRSPSHFYFVRPGGHFSMQFKSVALVASAIMFAACGGSETTPATDTAAPAVEAAPATLAAATGTVHEIKMVGDDKGYRFEPAALTIKSGDAVKFVAVSGFPHNVAFNGTTLSATAARASWRCATCCAFFPTHPARASPCPRRVRTPFSTMPTRWQSFSAISSTWVHMKTATPDLARAWKMSLTSRALLGSKPTMGSSKKSARGSCKSTPASTSFWRMPWVRCAERAPRS